MTRRQVVLGICLALLLCLLVGAEVVASEREEVMLTDTIFSGELIDGKLEVLLEGTVQLTPGVDLTNKQLAAGKFIIQDDISHQPIVDSILSGSIRIADNRFSLRAKMQPGGYELRWWDGDNMYICGYFSVCEHLPLVVRLECSVFRARNIAGRIDLNLAGRVLTENDEPVGLSSITGADWVGDITQDNDGYFTVPVMLTKGDAPYWLTLTAANGARTRVGIRTVLSRYGAKTELTSAICTGTLAEGKAKVRVAGAIFTKEGRQLTAEEMASCEFKVHSASPYVYGNAAMEGLTVLEDNRFSLQVRAEPGDYWLVSYTDQYYATATFTIKTDRPDLEGVKFTVGKASCLVFGQPTKIDAAPCTIDGVTFLSVKALEEPLDIGVQWQQATQSALFFVKNKCLRVTLGTTAADLDGKAVTMPAAPRLINGRVMVPMRFLGEQLGLEVHYDPRTKEVTVRNR